MNKQLTVLDLFCGCGGMSWGLNKRDFRILAGIDIWEQALNTFRVNHPDSATCNADLATTSPEEILHRLSVAPGDVDCIVGGPPCQGFSKNVPASYRFLEDPRNLLFRKFLAFVEYLRPRIVVMENVAEIYNAYDGAVREEIVTTLERLGYQVKVKVVFCPDYGVPQRRRRCFFYASNTGVAPDFPEAGFALEEDRTIFGTIRKYRSAWSAISDLPVLENGEGASPMLYVHEPENDYQRHLRAHSTQLYDHVTRKLNPKQLSRIASLQPGQGIKDLPEHLKPRSGYSGAYGRLNEEMVAPTITRWVFHPGSGRFCHPRQIRLLTIREAARIQSFSDDFVFTGTYIEKAHQVGNAVPPLIMEMLANQIKSACQAPLAIISQSPLGEGGVGVNRTPLLQEVK